jgi:alkanesulfonate monooxygenase SsuD/methylene tetrahydromethanopterin reductase-like flavin-dependent oxidoreductase (luciferase family)
MKIGLLLHPERGVDFVFEEARQADQQGYDSIWLGDHLMSGRGSWRGPDGPTGPLDAFTLMSAIGAITSQTRLAWSMLNSSFRYPAMLAKVLATLDVITKGRVICSLGSGSFPGEYEAYNIPLHEGHDARVAYTREVVQLLQELWTHPAPQTTTFNGKYVQVTDLPFNPEPYQKPRIPIWLGGESEATLQMIKELADGWVTLTRNANTSERGDAADPLLAVTSAPDWPKRAMTVVRQVRLVVGETEEQAWADARQSLGEKAGQQSHEIIGTPEECLAQFERQAKVGVNYLRVTFDNLSQQERVARLILPHLAKNPVGTK